MSPNLNSIFNAYTIRLPSPDGTVIVHCTEDSSGKLNNVIINIGKAGHSVAAWSDALAKMINLALRTHDLSDILEQISNITTGKSSYHPTHSQIKSGPDAVYRCLLMYHNQKNVPVSSATLPRISIPSEW